MAIQIVKDEEKFIYEAAGSKIFYRRISTMKRGQIVRKHTKRGKTDWTAVTKELIQAVILGWENVQDQGSQVDFSPETVLQLPDDVISDILDLSGAWGDEGADAEKN